MNTSKKEKIFKEKLEFFSHIVDGLGKGIEEGIIEPVTYLNLLGFHTAASCEGHTDGTAYPFGYILFETENVFNDEFILNKVYNEVRNRAFELEKEKFPDFDGTSETYSSEIDDFFNKNIEEGLENHPRYDQYLIENEKENKRARLEKKRITNLVEEFRSIYPEFQNKIYSDQNLAMPNIYFSSRNNYESFDDRSTKKEPKELERSKKESDEVINVFNKFLKEKYKKQ